MKKTASYQLMTNFLLWLAVVGVMSVLNFSKSDSNEKKLLVDEITKYVDIRLVGTVVAAGFIVFTIFSVLEKRSKKSDAQRHANEYAELILDEIGSTFYNFGSLLLACVIAGASSWYLVGTLICYGFGYIFKSYDA